MSEISNYHVTEVYKIDKHQNDTISIAIGQLSSGDDGFVVRNKEDIWERRKDLRGLRIRAGT